MSSLDVVVRRKVRAPQGVTAGSVDPNVPEAKSKNEWSSKPTKRWGSSLLDIIFLPIDPSSLAVCRILWGLLMFYEVYTYVGGGMNKAKLFFYTSDLRFHYYGFQWVTPPEDFYHIWLLLVSLLVAATLFTLGLCYRLASLWFLIGFSYVYLLDMQWYLNHFYLLCLVQFMFTITPANACWSFDNKIFRCTRKDTIPQWCVAIFQVTLAIVYFHAGLAKCNEDWLRGQPLKSWLPRRHFIPILGPFIATTFGAYFFSYAGLVFDILVGPAMLYRPTRLVFTILSVVFHLTNKLVFNIGIFPAMCLALTTLFHRPEWPRWLLDIVIASGAERSLASMAVRGLFKEELSMGKKDEDSSSVAHSDEDDRSEYPSPGITATKSPGCSPRALPSLYFRRRKRMARIQRRWRAERAPLTAMQIAVVVFLGLWVGFHLVFPLRHWSWPGNVGWNEYGHRFSWRMKLRDKQCEVQLQLRDPLSGVRRNVSALDHMTDRAVFKMHTRPEMIEQFAFHIAAKYEAQTGKWPEIYGEV